ncbi:Francisella virulence factor A [Facilibium subflavum]|uniref:Francisella virulence factor A n=1 Tax=Facilibium subflavum TaxID=2219058 RepID=UPI000E647897|nr:hypothetical protein [Facilibium subflavum]
MSRFQQNIIYAGLLIAIIGFFWFIVPKHIYQAHGVYLPKTTEVMKPINAKSVQFYAASDMNLPKAVPVVNNVNQAPQGIIRIISHYDKQSQIQAACQQNVTKAKALASAHGANVVIGNCVASQNTGPLDGASLYAYAYNM